jgi:hypothetical protein
VIAQSKSNALSMTTGDLARLKMEFYDYYFKLFEDAHFKMTKAFKLKLIAIKQCRKANRN